MQVDVLGALRATSNGEPVALRGERLCRLLARLALAGGRPVPVAGLIDDLWEGQPPADEAGALQSLVSRLRRALGDPQAVRQLAGGYQLDVSGDDVDALRAARLADAGRQALRRGEAAEASAVLTEALGLWRGDPAIEVPRADRVRLEDLRRTITLARAEAGLASGRADDVLPDLQALHDAQPLDERSAGLLLAALEATGRPAEALAGYERLRSRLADELGIDPSAELQDQHLRLLRATPKPAAASPPLRSWLTNFVGREIELQRVADFLATGRLVTVLGTGGAGKTRLAAEAAQRHQAGSPGPVWFVELAPLTDPAEVAQAVLSTVGRRESALLEPRMPRPSREATGLLIDALAGADALLVLDNCEHLLDAVAQLADVLLAHCPRLRILTTSREPLAIVGEALVPLPPLAVPDVGASAEVAGLLPAVQLLVARAAAVRPGFQLEAANVADVVEVVRRLDGLPLAIELAAARLRTLTLPEVTARLSDRFRLLTGGSRTALPRHRTLRAVVAWSWDLLTPAERLLAERIAVFPAGVTAESAAAVCADGALAAADVPELLDALLDKSLLEPAPGDGTRRRMLETIREYGVEQLAGRGELPDIRNRHARYFAAVARHADSRLRTAEQLPALQLLRAEHDNVMAALRQLCDQGAAADALRLVLSLAWYWQMLGRHAEATGWSTAALAVTGPADPIDQVSARAMWALSTAVSFDSTLGDPWNPQIELSGLARDLEPYDLADRPVVALALPVLLFFSGDMSGCSAALDRVAGSTDSWLVAAGGLLQARLAENEGDTAGIRAAADRALAGFRSLGDRWGMAAALPLIAVCRQYDGDLDGALDALREAAECSRALGKLDITDELFLVLHVAELHLRRGDLAAARDAATAGRELVTGGRTAEMSAITAALHAGVERLCGDLPAARARQRSADSAIRQVAGGPMAGHLPAIVGSTGAMLDIAEGNLPAAAGRLRSAYPSAVATGDLPILAMVGVTVAALAVAFGRHVDAAELLGAAARLRGADDPTNLDIRAVAAAARVGLGATAYDAAYAAGRALDREAAQARLDPTTLDCPPD